MSVMDTATTTPTTVEPIEVEIKIGTEYSDELWSKVTDTIDAAESELIRARKVKRQADAAYEAALAQRKAVQVPRDLMIATDSRVPGRVGLLAGVGRARCAIVRTNLLLKMGLAEVKGNEEADA